VETLACPHCSRVFYARPEIFGKRIRCRACQRIFGVPRKSATEAEPKGGLLRQATPKIKGGSLPIAIGSLIDGIDVRSCPQCGHSFAMKARYAGATIRCRACKTLYVVAGARAVEGQGVASATSVRGKRAAVRASVTGSPDFESPRAAANRHAAHSESQATGSRGEDGTRADDAGDVVPETEGGAQVPVAFESSPGLVYGPGPSVLGSAVAIVLGGVLAMPLAQLILWWGLGRDPMKFANKVPSALQWAVPPTLLHP